jgi:hypothetical protein
MNYLFNKKILAVKKLTKIVGAAAVAFCFLAPHAYADTVYGYLGNASFDVEASSSISSYVITWNLSTTTVPGRADLFTNAGAGCTNHVNFSDCNSPYGGLTTVPQIVPYSAFSDMTYPYYFSISLSSGGGSNSIDYFSIISSGQYNGGSFNPNSTRIISFTPDNGTTTLSGQPVSFSLHAYVNSADIGTFTGISFSLHNIDQNNLLNPNNDVNDIYFLKDFQATTSGDFYFSSTTLLSDGNYRINAILARNYLDGFINNPFSSLNQNLSHQFIVGTSTFLGNISQNSFNQLQSIYGSSTATSSLALSGTCNPFSGSASTLFFNTSFSPISCITFLFVPDSGYLNDTLVSFKKNVATHFPLGYVYDLVTILSTTTQSTIPVIDATVPVGIPGTGSHIHLDLAHSLDFILNATSSIYSSGTATSTQTWYQITSYYWNLFIYISLGIYIFGRVLGSHLIPKLLK